MGVKSHKKSQIEVGNRSTGKKNTPTQQSVPAILYLVQNNFQYFAAGILDVVTYAVSSQTKIIWTGLFTVVCLCYFLSLFGPKSFRLNTMVAMC